MKGPLDILLQPGDIGEFGGKAELLLILVVIAVNGGFGVVDFLVLSGGGVVSAERITVVELLRCCFSSCAFSSSRCCSSITLFRNSLNRCASTHLPRLTINHFKYQLAVIPISSLLTSLIFSYFICIR